MKLLAQAVFLGCVFAVATPEEKRKTRKLLENIAAQSEVLIASLKAAMQTPTPAASDWSCPAAQPTPIVSMPTPRRTNRGVGV
jgi:hypothetical protein